MITMNEDFLFYLPDSIVSYPRYIPRLQIIGCAQCCTITPDSHSLMREHAFFTPSCLNWFDRDLYFGLTMVKQATS